MRRFLGRGSDDVDERHVVISDEAIKDWTEEITDDFEVDSRFNVVRYNPTDAPAIDAILSEEILPYINDQADTVVTLPESNDSLDIPAMFGVTLGVAVGGAVATYAADDEEAYDMLGESVMNHIESYDERETWRVAGAPQDDFERMVRAGYDHYRELRHDTSSTPYKIDLDTDTRIIAHRSAEYDTLS